MSTLTRSLTAFVFLAFASAFYFGGTVAARATIYDADMMGQIKMTAQQRPEVKRILSRSGRNLARTLKKTASTFATRIRKPSSFSEIRAS